MTTWPTVPTARPTTQGPTPLRLIAGRYEDRGRLARGGMGEVRRVHDRLLQRMLGMKLLRWDWAADPRARRRFAREAQITGALQHPGIVPVHDRGELDDGRLWFTMPIVDGGTLKDGVLSLHDGAHGGSWGRTVEGWTLRRAIEVFRHVCDVMAYAHSQHVVHRDLKPTNIMVGCFGEVLVMDWGLAKRLKSATHEHVALDEWDSRCSAEVEVVGTPGFMAPEQALGLTDEIGPTTDVYALGAILRYILLGRELWDQPASAVFGAEGALRRPSIGELVPDDHPGLPAFLCELSERCLVPWPEGRPANASIVATEVALWLDGEERREEAQLRIAEADLLEPRVDEMRGRAIALRRDGQVQLRSLPPTAGAEDKEAAWRLEDAADELELRIVAAEVDWQTRLWSALHLDPDRVSIEARLAAHYEAALADAEGRGDAREAARLDAMLGLHRPQRRVEGTLALSTAPTGAEVVAFRYVERGRRLVCERVGLLGKTPLVGCALPAGSYLLELDFPGRAKLRYPVFVTRGEHVDAGGPRGVAISLPHTVPDGFVHMPPGWFISGGDAAATESLPRRRLYTPGALVARHPVTNAEYLEFLDHLVDVGDHEGALRHAPREPLGTRGETADQLAFERQADGRFALPRDENGVLWRPDWPIALVTWHDAMAFLRYRSERDHVSYRLLNELEWERAARGADGRVCGWGRHPEASWARLLGASEDTPSRASITAYPEDESPFLVRHTTGNVREWCSNVWTWEGPAVVDDVVELDAAEASDPSPRAARGGCWHSSPDLARAACRFAADPDQGFGGLGFRLALSWP